LDFTQFHGHFHYTETCQLHVSRHVHGLISVLNHWQQPLPKLTFYYLIIAMLQLLV